MRHRHTKKTITEKCSVEIKCRDLKWPQKRGNIINKEMQNDLKEANDYKGTQNNYKKRTDGCNVWKT